MSKGKVLFQLSGSIACYKSCYIISRLIQSGYEVEVVATRAALEFVGVATLEGLIGRPVHSDLYARSEMMSHINLIRWADVVILCPATANTIGKMAAGLGDDLVSTLFLAHDFSKPYLVAPAMNTHMYRHPATQSSIATLRQWGVEILETDSGTLACGEIGEGRLLDPDLIYARITEAINGGATAPNADKTIPPKALATLPHLRVLITSGGTREPIDGVRAITNFSSGKTGAQIADHLHSHGHKVTVVQAEDSATPLCEQHGANLVKFTTFQDLRSILQSELKSHHYDVVLHMAAVSDYSISKIESNGAVVKSSSQGKIDSDGDLKIHLTKNPKLIDQLRSLSLNPKVQIVAFKLTNTTEAPERLAAVKKLAAHAQADYVVHNDLSEINTKTQKHTAQIFKVSSTHEIRLLTRVESKSDLAETLERIFCEVALEGEGS